MRESPLILYVEGYFTNVWDATCYVALREKGLEFDTARALLRDGQGVPAGLRDNAAIGRIPALQHGHFWLTESLAIAEYLEEMFPPPTYPALFPLDWEARGRARQVMSWLRSDIRQLRDERPWQTTVYPTSLPPLGPLAARQAAELIEVVDWLARAGALAAWNLAHADLAFALMRLTSSAYVLSPAAQALLDANLARPSVRAYLEMQRPPHPPPQARS